MICPSCGSENLEGNDRCENCLASFRDLDIPGADKAEGLARHVMEDTLSALDHESPIVVAPDTPASEVARRMKEAGQGCALVLDGPKLVGIFTEHDVLNRMSAAFESTSPVPSTDTSQISDEPTTSTSNVVPFADTPSIDMPLEEIRADEMQSEEIASGSTAGTRFSSALQVQVKDLMSPNPETLQEGESIAFALNRMSIGRYRHIPIKKEDGSYSVASIKAVLKYIAREEW